MTYIETPTGKGAVFNRANESRIEYSFAKGFPTQGTLEWRIYVTSAYGYSEGVFTANRPNALIFTTVGPDTWYPGCSWFTVSQDGSMTFGMADSVGGQTPVRNLVAKETKFRFGAWHTVGISFGKEGRAINLDGQVVAADKLPLPLGAGGTPSQVANVPTIGEMKSKFWKNNQHDSGFNGVIDIFRASPIQKDWQLCVPNSARPQNDPEAAGFLGAAEEGILDEQIRQAQANRDNEAVVAYGGKVGKLEAIFLLEFGGDQVVGYYFHPTRDKNARYLLRGTNPEGVLILQEFTRAGDGKEIHTASCRLTKTVSDSRIRWSGYMNSADGRSLPVYFSRPR